MEIIDKILSDNTLKIIAIVLIITILIALIMFFVQYNIDRAKGKHAKFLWFESNIPSTNETTEARPSNDFSNSKNINTGTNSGNIGDKYEGLKQRTIDNNDERELLDLITNFKNDYSDRINNSHLTIGHPGDKESMNLAQQVESVLRRHGYHKLQSSILQTYGVVGKKFGVSNAPDDTILIEIYPADNVE